MVSPNSICSSASSKGEPEHWLIASEKNPPLQELPPGKSIKFKGLFELHHFPGRCEVDATKFTLDNRDLTVKEIKEVIGVLTQTDPSYIKISFYTRLLTDADGLVERTNAHGLGTEVFKVWYKEPPLVDHPSPKSCGLKLGQIASPAIISGIS